MNKNRPVNLDLRTIKQPLPAISSILHRATGVILFAGFVFVLYALDRSLASPEGFAHIQGLLQTSFCAKFITWGFLSALLYHLFAGVKHLVMDFGYCEELESGRWAAKIVLLLGLIGVLLTGVWVW